MKIYILDHNYIPDRIILQYERPSLLISTLNRYSHVTGNIRFGKRRLGENQYYTFISPLNQDLGLKPGNAERLGLRNTGFGELLMRQVHNASLYLSVGNGDHGVFAEAKTSHNSSGVDTLPGSRQDRWQLEQSAVLLNPYLTTD